MSNFHDIMMENQQRYLELHGSVTDVSTILDYTSQLSNWLVEESRHYNIKLVGLRSTLDYFIENNTRHLFRVRPYSYNSILNLDQLKLSWIRYFNNIEQSKEYKIIVGVLTLICYALDYPEARHSSSLAMIIDALIFPNISINEIIRIK